MNENKPAKKLGNPQLIINNLISPFYLKENFNWGKECKFANNLIKEHGLAFMLWLKPHEGYKVSSLIYYCVSVGREFLLSEKQKFNVMSCAYENNVSIKIIHPQEPTPKPKTLKEFLNYGQKIRESNPNATI